MIEPLSLWMPNLQDLTHHFYPPIIQLKVFKA